MVEIWAWWHKCLIKHGKSNRTLTFKALSCIWIAIKWPTFTLYRAMRQATNEALVGWRLLSFLIGLSTNYTNNHQNLAAKVREALAIGTLELVTHVVSAHYWVIRFAIYLNSVPWEVGSNIFSSLRTYWCLTIYKLSYRGVYSALQKETN